MLNILFSFKDINLLCVILDFTGEDANPTIKDANIKLCNYSVPLGKPLITLSELYLRVKSLVVSIILWAVIQFERKETAIYTCI